MYKTRRNNGTKIIILNRLQLQWYGQKLTLPMLLTMCGEEWLKQANCSSVLPGRCCNTAHMRRHTWVTKHVRFLRDFILKCHDDDSRCVAGQVIAFRDAALIVIEIQSFRPQRQTQAVLKPSTRTGGRPCYNLLQLYHSMCLKLG